MQLDLAKLENAQKQGKLLSSSLENLRPYIDATWLPQWARMTLAELVESNSWDELNDRFYKSNQFGTAGVRGRTISKLTPVPEAGTRNELGAPEHAAVGSATLNDFNIIRATIGFYRYCAQFLEQAHRKGPALLIVAYDVRHFSRHFAQLTASTWQQLGGQAILFDGPRSVPELSFTVRNQKATAGVMITASHNPAHDNGYKAYFEDGGQIVAPHDKGIADAVAKVKFDEVAAFLELKMEGVKTIGATQDQVYLEALGETLLEPTLLKEYPPRLVYSAVHGTGSVAIIPALEKYTGHAPAVVAEQMVFDGRFPTVESPNPQNPEALSMAMQTADELKIDVVVATDPDDDRMGAAVRDRNGKWLVLSGNTLGSLFAQDRLEHMKQLGILPPQGHPGATIIKTFVTTPLQEAIAKAHGVTCIDTLTGFKWIGHKLDLYEKKIRQQLADAEVKTDYDQASLPQRRAWALEYARYFCFGGEESYGYLASDRVRDKDGNAGVLMLAELMARAASQSKTLLDKLDELYLQYGYFGEDQLQITFEGASGALQRKKIFESYMGNPPFSISSKRVVSSRNFVCEEIVDIDQELLPGTQMMIFDLEDGSRVAIRPSGTEPKIRYYLFAHAQVHSSAELEPTKQQVAAQIEQLKAGIEQDLKTR